LSLVEVSEASSIVQEAADEDANIIFGAVVDPALKGKVKITVIATGFGPETHVRPAGSAAYTPVDMTPFTEQTRLRADSAAAMATPRMSIARRPLLDLPITLSSGPTALWRRCPVGGPCRRVDPVHRRRSGTELDLRRAGVPAPAGGLSQGVVAQVFRLRNASADRRSLVRPRATSHPARATAAPRPMKPALVRCRRLAVVE